MLNESFDNLIVAKKRPNKAYNAVYIFHIINSEHF